MNTKPSIAQIVINAQSRFGAITDTELPILAGHATSRLWPVVVRLGGCRFTAPAQDAGKIINALELSGDYVRDVSIDSPACQRQLDQAKRDQMIAECPDWANRRKD